jgi:hypothetical protein
MHRTTILLDKEARQATSQLSERLGISASEVIRRALLNLRDQVVGPSPARRRERVAALHTLSRMFEGKDVEAEIRALKRERAR